MGEWVSVCECECVRVRARSRVRVRVRVRARARASARARARACVRARVRVRVRVRARSFYTCCLIEIRGGTSGTGKWIGAPWRASLTSANYLIHSLHKLEAIPAISSSETCEYEEKAAFERFQRHEGALHGHGVGRGRRAP